MNMKIDSRTLICTLKSDELRSQCILCKSGLILRKYYGDLLDLMGNILENSVLILRLNFIKCNHLRLPESSLSATLGCHVSLCFFFFFCLILWPQHVSWGMLSKLNALGPKIWRQDCRKKVAKNQEVHIRTIINVPI